MQANLNLFVQLEDNLEREKKVRADVEKAKKKVEQDLKATQETVEDLERAKRDLEENVRRYTTPCQAFLVKKLLVLLWF